MKHWAAMCALGLVSACGGSSPDSAEVVTASSVEPAGSLCPTGGETYRWGLDENENGKLDAAEVQDTKTSCTPQLGDSLTRIDAEAPGEHCKTGGRAVHSGIDTNDDGQLGDDEVQATQYICTDEIPPTAPLVLQRSDAEPPGEHCSAGGSALRDGYDSNRNGLLDDAEIEHSTYQCHVGALTRLDDEPAGDVCAAGGKLLSTGPDLDGNGKLGDDEIKTTEPLCGTVIDGDYYVNTPEQVAALADVVVITGTLKVGDMLAELSSAKLRSVGSLKMTRYGQLARLSLPALTHADIIDLSHADSLEVVDLSQLKLASSVYISSTPVLSAIHLEQLASGGVQIVDAPALLKLELTSLTDATHVWVGGTDALQELDLPVLAYIGGLELRANKLASLILPELRNVAENLWVPPVPSSFPKLESVGGDLNVRGAVSLPVLKRVGGGFAAGPSSTLITLHLPVLEAVGGEFAVWTTRQLTSVSAPKLYTLSGELTVGRNDALETLSLPSLQHLPQGLMITGNSKLATLEGLSNLDSIAGYARIYGNRGLVRLGMPRLRSVQFLSTQGGQDFDGVTHHNDKLETLDLPALALVESLGLELEPALVRFDLPALRSVLVNMWVLNAPLLPRCRCEALQAQLATTPALPTMISFDGVDEAGVCD